MKSPIKWTSGKLGNKEFVDLIPNMIYIEPFFGGGALYWYLQPETVINDINIHLITFIIH